jgi:sec-independent protein translocase protein TatC
VHVSFPEKGFLSLVQVCIMIHISFRKRKSYCPVFLIFFVTATPILFILGASFVYYVVVPIAWEFFLGFEQSASKGILAVQLEPKVDEYLSLIMRLILAFGICFELPILLVLLTKIGITNSRGLKQKRKYAILVAFVIAAIVTPPDVISQVLLAIPIILLYEVSIVCAGIMEKK